MYGRYNAMPMPVPFSGQSPHGNVAPYPTPGYGTNANTVISSDSRWDMDMQSLISNLKTVLSNASVDELSALTNDEGKLMTLIEDSEELKKMKSERGSLAHGNKDLALVNLSLKPELEIKREQLLTNVQKQRSLKDEYDRLKKRVGELSGNFSLDTTLALMKASVSEKDSETEILAQRLLDSEIQLEDFLDEYISQRTLYHLKRTKADKMSDIVMKSSAYYSGGYGRY